MKYVSNDGQRWAQSIKLQGKVQIWLKLYQSIKVSFAQLRKQSIKVIYSESCKTWIP